MSITAAAGILAPFAGPILDIVKRVIPDPVERAKVEAELQEGLADAEARFAESTAALAQSQASVIVAEAQGSAMQRNWRPTLMYVLMGLLVWYAVAVPVLTASLGVPITDVVGLDHIPEGLWTLLTVGMGGYIGGRSFEKVFAYRAAGNQ